MSQIREIVKAEVSKATKLAEDHVEDAVKKTFATPTPSEQNVKTLADLKTLFTVCRNELGLKIAVCTTDDRKPTIETLKMQGIT